ncbi:MAG: ADP-ribosylation/Crystallin [Proteobacteria bacterium]|nr:ADP-ribosylation/Crystallin [Pseudomonadota bacterium]
MPHRQPPPPPLENAYWVEPGRLLAGEYPAAGPEQVARARIRKLLDAGIGCFLDLTEPGELESYERWLPGPYGRDAVAYLRKPIPDHSLPARPEHTREILDEIDAALAEGRSVYVHCRAGIGRTNLVVGCWLARRGHVGEAALTRLNELWQSGGRAATWPTVPETAAQVDYVRAWREGPEPPAAPAGEVATTPTLTDRYRGLLLGLAAGDACGQAVAHRRAGTFTPLGDMIGGGPFDLPRGAWSDKTAMALCLAESLAETGGVDATDQVGRYLCWQREGHLSSTGQCVGISAETARALAQAQWTGNPMAGSFDPLRPRKEPLARVGPAVALLLPEPEEAIEAAVDATRVTHQAPVTLDAVRYLAALLVGALQGVPRHELARPLYSPVEGYWVRHRLKPEIEAVARGSWAEKAPPRIYGGGQAAEALEAALWAFNRARSFRDAVLAAANLGGDADVTAAVAGQLAGAHFGAAGIPAAWRGSIAGRDRIVALADQLLARALSRLAG